MLKEFVEKILSLAEVKPLEIHQVTYTDRPLTLVKPPCLSTVPLLTLTGLVDAITQTVDGLKVEDWLLHVVTHGEVQLITRKTDDHGRRIVLARVKLEDGAPFPFGRFIDREEFVIGLQSQFVPNPDHVELLKLSSTLEASTVALAEDDGVSQRTTVKQGVTLKASVTVKGRVSLQPYRTFREIDQPASIYVFRLRSQGGGIPECALFEPDGGKWKLDAILAIKTWLESKNLGMPVIA